MKHVFLTIILTILLSVGLGYAQSSEYAWANQISGGFSDDGDGIAMDGDGNVFVCGTFGGTITIGTETLDSNDTSDSFIIKYDSDGNFLWAKSSENTGSNRAYSVATDPLGNSILTGLFEDSITFDDWTLTSLGDKDIYIIKFDTNGTVIWAKKAGGYSDDSGRAISVNNLGEIFISGYFKGTVYFDSVVLPNYSNRLFIAKYDINGNAIWAKETGGYSPGDNTGGYTPYITSDVFGNCYVTYHSYSNIYVRKYDSTGNAIWRKIINSQKRHPGDLSSTHDYDAGIAVDSSGNVFVAGSFDGILNFASDTLDCFGSSSWEDIFLAKYDPAGNEVWARQICGAHYEGGQTNSITTDNNDNIIVTGYFEESINVEGKTLTSNGSDKDIFLCKYDNDGNLLWAVSNGGYRSDRGHGVAANECGNIAVMGSFRSRINFGLTSLDCQSWYDLFVTKVSITYAGDFDKDCDVDMPDFLELATAWLSEVGQPQWNDECNISEPEDSIIDFNDFVVFSEHWMQGVSEYPDGMVFVSIFNSGFAGEMSKYETTNAQYCQFLNMAIASGDVVVDGSAVRGADGSNGGADFAGQPYLYTYPGDPHSQIAYSGGVFSVRSRDGFDMSNHPVVTVSWYGATGFCNYYGYRLPSEWEWEAVADFDGSYTYGCGETIDQGKANYINGGHANPLGLSGFPYTSPVGHYSDYGYGVCDMAGNVWEWTSSDNGGTRIFRGGSWDNAENACTVSIRYENGPDNTYYSIGFRVCR